LEAVTQQVILHESVHATPDLLGLRARLHAILARDTTDIAIPALESLSKETRRDLARAYAANVWLAPGQVAKLDAFYRNPYSNQRLIGLVGALVGLSGIMAFVEVGGWLTGSLLLAGGAALVGLALWLQEYSYRRIVSGDWRRAAVSRLRSGTQSARDDISL
jgi:hypothetical protein